MALAGSDMITAIDGIKTNFTLLLVVTGTSHDKIILEQRAAAEAVRRETEAERVKQKELALARLKKKNAAAAATPSSPPSGAVSARPRSSPCSVGDHHYGVSVSYYQEGKRVLSRSYPSKLILHGHDGKLLTEPPADWQHVASLVRANQEARHGTLAGHPDQPLSMAHVKRGTRGQITAEILHDVNQSVKIASRSWVQIEDDVTLDAHTLVVAIAVPVVAEVTPGKPGGSRMAATGSWAERTGAGGVGLGAGAARAEAGPVTDGRERSELVTLVTGLFKTDFVRLPSQAVATAIVDFIAESRDRAKELHLHPGRLLATPSLTPPTDRISTSALPTRIDAGERARPHAHATARAFACVL